MVRITFLAPITPNIQPTARERGLEDAKAKSHAAGVAHQRAGHQRWLSKRAKFSSARGNQQYTQYDDHKGNFEPENIQHIMFPSPSNVQTGPLEPFMVLPSNLDVYEQRMLHLCGCPPRPMG